MDRFAKLVVLACAFTAGSAHAVYTQLTPPAGWNAGSTALWSPPSNSFAAQTANQWISNAARTSAMLNVGGRQVALQARLGLSPSAGRIMAAAIYNSPHVRAAVGIASLLQTTKIVYDESSKRWQIPGTGPGSTPSDGLEYRGNYGGASNLWSATPEDACANLLPVLIAGDYINHWSFDWSLESVENGQCKLRGKRKGGSPLPDEFAYRSLETRVNSCQAGWYSGSEGCTSTPQVPARNLTQKEMVDLLNPDNHVGWPTTVPNELPLGTPLPVELPVVNPSTGVDPFGRPQFIPTGDPVRNPNYDASKPMTADNQPFLQPGVRVTPRPTTENPWQVDTQPVDRPQSTPDRLPESELNPDTDSGQDSSDKPKDEETMSLCEKHPDILACQNLDQPEDRPLDTIEKPISITPDSGWGAENASCPPPKMLHVQGRQIAIPFDLFCTYMQGMRPIIIAMAWLSAAFILVGARENS